MCGMWLESIARYKNHVKLSISVQEKCSFKWLKLSFLVSGSELSTSKRFFSYEFFVLLLFEWPKFPAIQSKFISPFHIQLGYKFTICHWTAMTLVFFVTQTSFSTAFLSQCSDEYYEYASAVIRNFHLLERSILLLGISNDRNSTITLYPSFFF